MTGSIDVVIPALNEEGAIAELVDAVRKEAVDRVLVVDNGSQDQTATIARRAGAEVVVEARRGYGYACAAGAREATGDFLVFLDGDFSSLPSELPLLMAPLLADRADLVLGSRLQGEILPGAMPPHQLFGNWLISALMRRLYQVSVTDLGPYRAIRRPLLAQMSMGEMTFGWPTEMMAKAARLGIRILEVPVSYHPRRAGRSKVSGTVRGSVLAAYFIVGSMVRYRTWEAR